MATFVLGTLFFIITAFGSVGLFFAGLIALYEGLDRDTGPLLFILGPIMMILLGVSIVWYGKGISWLLMTYVG